MVKNRLYIVYSMITFLGASIVLFIVFSRLVAYFKTPGNTTIPFHSDLIADHYRPVYSWHPFTNEGREMESHSIQKITQDYFSGLYKHSMHLSQGDTIGIHDLFTKSKRRKVKQFSSSLARAHQKVAFTTLSHNLDLKLYSDDGTMVVFDDIQINYHQLFENEQLTGGYYDTAKFEVMLMLEDNFWRVRHKVRSVLEGYSNPIAKKDSCSQNIAIKGYEFYENNKVFRSKGINYYPAKYPWEKFWANFKKLPLKEDFSLISQAGFNTVRVFIPYDQFGGAEVGTEYLENLEILLALADDHNLKVIVTLFDFFLGYQTEHWTLSQRHAETIVKKFNTHPAIFAWDIKNEPDLDFENHGEEEVKEWLKFMSKSIRSYDANHLITIGWSTPEYIELLAPAVDYYSFHYYKAPSDLESYVKKDFEKPVILEETGQHSFNAWWYPYRKSKEDQAIYMAEILATLKKYGLSYTYWTLYDFQNIPDNVVGKVYWKKGIQKNFGLIDKKGKPKPVFELIKTYNQSN